MILEKLINKKKLKSILFFFLGYNYLIIFNFYNFFVINILLSKCFNNFLNLKNFTYYVYLILDDIL
jgi:hypothetical protein